MTTWVLLRGLARDSRHWESFPAAFEQLLPDGARVITLDLPGNGSRAGETSPASLAAMVDAYRGQLRAIGVTEPVDLLGLSLGAMVAVEWASRRPEEISSVVLVNGSTASLSHITDRLRPRAAWQLLMSAVQQSAAQRERRIVGVCTNLVDVEFATRRWALHAASSRTSTFNTFRQLVAAMRWRLPRSRPAVPMIVLASAADQLVSAECSIAIARFWSLPIVLHPTAGHELAMDDPGWLARQCARWSGAMLEPRG